MKHIFGRLSRTAALATAALFAAPSANAATYLIDLVIDDRVYDVDSASDTTGIDTVHLTGEVVTNGFGRLSDVLQSWSFTMEDRDSVNTISSEGLVAGTLGDIETVQLSGLDATASGLFSVSNLWAFQESVRVSGDYYVGYVSNNLGKLQVQDIRQSPNPDTGSYGEEFDFFTSVTPVLFGSIYDPVTMAAVPLPAGLSMLFAGLGALGVLRRKKT